MVLVAIPALPRTTPIRTPLYSPFLNPSIVCPISILVRRPWHLVSLCTPSLAWTPVCILVVKWVVASLGALVVPGRRAHSIVPLGWVLTVIWKFLVAPVVV